MAHSAQLNILEQNCPIQVEHDRKRRQFTVKLNGCHDRAVLLYEYVGKRIVDLQHTEVPDSYRGRGIAKHLAKLCWKTSQVQPFNPCLRGDRYIQLMALLSLEEDSTFL
ncbi:protein NATD1 isoform X2 [Antechinus flavipes]|uniref:protein NATD1 isoform X2 n=1 Tax=Antechinus flavipes TaxID=38775 RepID=UPI0022363CB9|nr:protein NATD1 isoform X2 [Antechinus flavipes]